MRRGSVACAGALLLATLALGSTAAVANPLPPYNGVMTFPAIMGPSSPSEFSWEVQLGEGQALEQIDDQGARVYYTESLATAVSVLVEPAHDANGASVPTGLAVSGGNVITLFVLHQAGNPAAGERRSSIRSSRGQDGRAGSKPKLSLAPKTNKSFGKNAKDSRGKNAKDSRGKNWKQKSSSVLRDAASFLGSRGGL